MRKVLRSRSITNACLVWNLFLSMMPNLSLCCCSSGSLRYNFLPAEMDLNDLPANWLKREELVLLDPHLLADREAEGTDLDGKLGTHYLN